MSEPTTEAAHKAMAVMLRHSAYCVVQVGWTVLVNDPGACICELLPDILAIEAQAAPDALLREALARLVAEYDEDMNRTPSFTSMREAVRALALTPATPPASAECRCGLYAQLHGDHLADCPLYVGILPGPATPPASAEREHALWAAHSGTYCKVCEEEQARDV